MDEASRERFIYPYRRYTKENTADFLRRAFEYFGYQPITLQTDNGGEFRAHNVRDLLDDLSIVHKFIKPYTPRHNGKIERSHLDDETTHANMTYKTMTEVYTIETQLMDDYNNAMTRAFIDDDGQIIKKPNDHLYTRLEMRNRLTLILFARMCELGHFDLTLQQAIHKWAELRRQEREHQRQAEEAQARSENIIPTLQSINPDRNPP